MNNNKRLFQHDANNEKGKKSSVVVGGNGNDKRQTSNNNNNSRLPVISHRLEFLTLLQSFGPTSHRVVIITGATGSGKTTQIPQFLLDDFHARRIAVTQPRRVAAITLAQRVAHERRCSIATEVGYKVRFDNQTDAKLTSICFVTDGMLLREAILDHELSSYDVIVLDEAHERSLNTDILFGIVRRALSRRNPTKSPLTVVIMSATLTVSTFQTFFHPLVEAKILHIAGRQFPVSIFYMQDPTVAMGEFVENAAITTLQIHHDEPLPGDVLVFLPGRDDIEACVDLLRRHGNNTSQLDIIPLFASLSPQQQLAAFAPTLPGRRKIVVATNVAETSVTIDGVRFVVDCGVVKSRTYKPKSGLRALEIGPISKAQAEQRSGRAGREAPGKTFRLYSEDYYDGLLQEQVPEIKRVDLTEVVMQLLALGVDDLKEFAFLDRPHSMFLKRALDEMLVLGAMISKPSGGGLMLTPLGHAMSHLPVEPIYAGMLLRAKEWDCVDEIATIVATSYESSESLFDERGRKTATAKITFADESGDHMTFCKVLTAFETECHNREDRAEFAKVQGIRVQSAVRALKIKQQLMEQLKNNTSIVGGPFYGTRPPPEMNKDDDTRWDRVLQCLAASMVTRCAQKNEDGTNTYIALGRTEAEKHALHIHPSSSLFSRANKKRPEWVIFDEVLVTSKPYLRTVTEVDAKWLRAGAPKLFRIVEEKIDVGQATTANVAEVELRKRRKIVMCD